MKILTLGLSPYMYLSHSRIHAMILKNLYFSDHEVACVAIGHDTTYFLSKPDKQGIDRYYYSFDDNHNIPLIPLDITKEPAVVLYEIINALKPEIIITIGDFNDFWYMKAVKMFAEVPLKWIAILTNYSYPINEKNIDIINDMDGILCSNNKTYDMMKTLFKKDEIFLSHVGSPETSKFIDDRENLRKCRNIENKFRIMNCGKNLQSDNIPMLMEVVAKLRAETEINLELYLHTNIHDKGDYDLNLIKERFDFQDKFIRFPDKYVSFKDGYTDSEYEQELVCSDLFISISLNSASAISVFESISCGCLPLMANTGCHQDISKMITDLDPEFQRNDLLIPCIEVMTRGEVYVNICKPDALYKGIIKIHEKIKKGYNNKFRQFIISHNQKMFLNDILGLIEAVKCSAPTLCVETV